MAPTSAAYPEGHQLFLAKLPTALRLKVKKDVLAKKMKVLGVLWRDGEGGQFGKGRGEGKSRPPVGKGGKRVKSTQGWQ